MGTCKGVLGLAFAMAAGVCGAASGEVLFEEDFDGLEAGSLHNQNGWRLNGGAGGANDDFTVQSGWAARGGAGKAARYLNDGTTPDTSWAAHSFSGATAGQVLGVSFWVYGDATGRRSMLAKLPSGPNPWDAAPLEVRAYADGNTGWVEKFGYVDNGAWVNSDITMTANAWWRIRLDYDMTAASAEDYTYSFYVMQEGQAEQAVAEDIAVRGGLASYMPQWFYVQRYYGGATDDWALDDITVTAVPEPASLLLLSAGLLAMVRRRG